MNVSVAGTGPIFRSHRTSSGGANGLYHYTTHGTENDRAGVASGTVTLDGVVVNAGGMDIGSHLFTSKSAETDVIFCQPKLGC